MRSGSRHSTRWAALLLCPLATSCLVTDDRCGKNQVELSEGSFGACTCAEGTVPSANNVECVPCSGAFEVAMNGSCQCMAGYSKVAGACTQMTDTGASPAADSGLPAARQSGTVGQESACANSEDCSGKDATFCMTLGPMPQCLVQDCGLNGTRSCDSERVCCDISNLAGLLPALSTTNGLCLPMGGCTTAMGKVVTP